VEQERQRYEQEGRQFSFPGWSQTQFETEAGRREFWEILEIQIGQALDAFARERAAAGQDHSFFAGETTKGLQLLEIMSERYDVVVTNPPYMSARKMNPRLNKLVSDAYPAGKGDLYAAFIQRCIEFSGQHGWVGMLTMHSFMFISSYASLRSYIRERMTIDTLVHTGPGLFAVGNPGTLQTAAYVLSRESNEQTRNAAFRTYFRLVKEPDGEAKRRRFEQALAAASACQADPVVFCYRQGGFDTIPSSPWVYWITPGVHKIFATHPSLGRLATPKHGMSTGKNSRFLRLWWEVGISRIDRARRNREEAKYSTAKWFPYMKGGSFKRWYGNQSFVLNYQSMGAEMLAGRGDGTVSGHRHDNPDLYFHRGVTWTDLTSGRFSARLSPGGFIFDVSGSSVFPNDVELVLGVMNSQFAQYVLKLINPTVHVQVGDLARLPIHDSLSPEMSTLVRQAIELAKAENDVNETTYDFITPPSWETGITDMAEKHRKLAEVESEIDKEVHRLYAISDEDRAAIEAELAESAINGASDEESDNPSSDAEDAEVDSEAPLTRAEQARQWVSYAVGIVMGRFQPGIDGALGRGHFPSEVAANLRALADSDGILVLDQGHPDDIATRVLQVLQLMLGEEVATKVIAEGTGRIGNPAEELHRYFERNFFKEHIQKYRKRPVYWLLQSPRKKYGVWLFHEKLTKDTLYRIRDEQYVASQIRLLDAHIADLRQQRETAQGRERRALEKQMAELDDVLDDIRAFAERIDTIIQRGYTPHIDDGVLITMAPLWELIPSWQAEPKKCWEALERGDYDWAHQAMDHWPDRVRDKCETYRSYAIAHGLV
jgi:hypothetical protein